MDHANDTDPAIFAAVLTELKHDARTPVKEVIEVYDPSLNYEENLTNLEAIPASNLEATAIFLGQEVRCATSGVQKYHSVTTLADWIIMRIEGFCPQICSECTETYSVKRNENPPARCYICGGGLHNCAKILAEVRSTATKSRIWVCSPCLGKQTLERFTSHLPDGGLDPSLDSTRRNSNRDQILGRHLSRTVEEEITPREDAADPGDQGERGVSGTDVCRFYLQRRCRHGRNGSKLVSGRSCPKTHPTLCKKYCNYGTMRSVGCQNTECNLFHPPLCKNSELRHECYKQSCTKQLLKDTRRTRPAEGTSRATGNERNRRDRNPSAQSRPTGQNRAPESGPWSSEPSRARVSSGVQWSQSQIQRPGPDPAFLEAVLDRLRDSIAGIVRTEMRNRPEPEPDQFYSQPAQLPAGTGYTFSPHQQRGRY